VSRFDAARRAALIRSLLDPLLGHSTELLAFEDVKEKLHLRHLVDRGLQQIPLDLIVGSLGRATEFDRGFLPRREALRERWRRIEQLAEGSEGFPPVELYKVGEVYFVVDGHHRVSVARSLAAPTIEARVQEFSTRVPLSPGDSPRDLLMKQCQVDFLEATGLEPSDSEDFSVTLPQGYQRLLEHISVHRDFRGLEEGREIGREEAVVSWRDSVYRPLLEILRRQEVLAAFPGRTETDLYLFLMDNLHYLREQLGDAAPPPEGAVDDFKRAQGRQPSVLERLKAKRPDRKD
jgi:hypothetical protein